MFNGTTFTALKTSEIGCPFAGNPFIRQKQQQQKTKTTKKPSNPKVNWCGKGEQAKLKNI